MENLEQALNYLEETPFMSKRVADILNNQDYFLFLNEFPLPEDINRIDICSVLYGDGKLSFFNYSFCLDLFFSLSEDDKEKYLKKIGLFNKYNLESDYF